jgi:hypothetical protein
MVLSLMRRHQDGLILAMRILKTSRKTRAHKVQTRVTSINVFISRYSPIFTKINCYWLKLRKIKTWPLAKLKKPKGGARMKMTKCKFKLTWVIKMICMIQTIYIGWGSLISYKSLIKIKGNFSYIKKTLSVRQGCSNSFSNFI